MRATGPRTARCRPASAPTASPNSSMMELEDTFGVTVRPTRVRFSTAGLSRELDGESHLVAGLVHLGLGCVGGVRHLATDRACLLRGGRAHPCSGWNSIKHRVSVADEPGMGRVAASVVVVVAVVAGAA